MAVISPTYVSPVLAIVLVVIDAEFVHGVIAGGFDALDTNVFVAAGFNPRSASARILTGLREGRFRLIWNEPTRRETEMILRRIPRLDWEKAADLFRPEEKFTGSVDPDAFALITDPDDREFAALSAAAKAPLVTNDRHVLVQSRAVGIEALTPSAFLAERANAASW